MYLYYINNLRGVAIYFIVATHCVSVFDWGGGEINHRYLMYFFSNSTILFVFVSGYLFQHLSVKYDYLSYVNKKIKYVGIPYVVCSVPAIIYFLYFYQRPEAPVWIHKQPALLQVVSLYATGTHLSPYWFIPMIFIVYAVSPMIVFMDKNNWIYYCLPILIMVSVEIPRGGNFVQNLFHLFSVYVLGMFFSKNKNYLNRYLGNWYFCIITLLASFVMLYVEFKYSIEISYFQKILLVLSFLSFFIINKEKEYSNLKYLAEASFGTYFIHSYFITLYKNILFKYSGKNMGGSVLSFIVFSFVVIVVCTCLVYVVKYLFKTRSRILIGS